MPISKGLASKENIELLCKKLSLDYDKVVARIKGKVSGKAASWTDYMEAMRTLSGLTARCPVCESPMAFSAARKKTVCLLVPAHSYIRQERDLGPLCDHDLYLLECPVCLEVEKKTKIERYDGWKQS